MTVKQGWMDLRGVVGDQSKKAYSYIQFITPPFHQKKSTENKKNNLEASFLRKTVSRTRSERPGLEFCRKYELSWRTHFKKFFEPMFSSCCYKISNLLIMKLRFSFIPSVSSFEIFV